MPLPLAFSLYTQKTKREMWEGGWEGDYEFGNGCSSGYSIAHVEKLVLRVQSMEAKR